MIQQDEEWRSVSRDENYQVSSLGRVRRITNACGTRSGKILKACPARGGYLRVNLNNNGEKKDATIHRLVCEAFHGPSPSPLHEVAHSNGVRTDNRAINLSWKTKAENSADRIAHGTMKFGEACNLAKFSTETVLAVRAAPGKHRDIGRQFGMSKSQVSNIKARRAWSHL